QDRHRAGRRGRAHHAARARARRRARPAHDGGAQRPRLPGRRRRRAPHPARPAEGRDRARAPQAPGAAGARAGGRGARRGVAGARGRRRAEGAQGTGGGVGAVARGVRAALPRGAGDGARAPGGEGRVRRAEKENRMSLEQEVELIRQFPIFAKIQPAMQKLLCFSSERLTFAPGQVIVKAGDIGDAAFIVIEGEVEISVPTPSGPIVVNTAGRNAIIGEIAIFGDVPRTATATAKSAVETLKISKELFTKIIRENPDAALELIRILAARLANTTAQLSRTVSGTKS